MEGYSGVGAGLSGFFLTKTKFMDGCGSKRIRVLIFSAVILGLVAALVVTLSFSFSSSRLVPSSTTKVVEFDFELPSLEDSVSVVDESNLPPLNPSYLDSVQCIPKICFRQTNFTSSRNFTLLASFPGSGNTWTRSIIESGTRVYTGSVYDDKALYHNGFKGELIDNYARNAQTSVVSAIKTHYPYYPGEIHRTTTAAIVIMRCPFEAILAEFSRRWGRGATAHTGLVSQRALLREFPDVFTMGMRKWRIFSSLWIGPRIESARRSRENGVTSYEYERKNGGKPFPVLIMFYEDFVREPVVAIHRLMAFIKLQMQDAMPNDELEAMICALTEGRKTQTKEKREHPKDEYNVYLDDTNTIGRKRMVQAACKEWAPYWFEDIWGPCGNESVTQRDRHLPSPMAHKLDRVVNVCDG